MNSYDEAFLVKLRKKIVAGREQATNILLSGNVPDMASYKDQVGYLRALNDIEMFCEQTAEELN